MMKKIFLSAILFLVLGFSASAQSLCTVYGTIYTVFGQPAPRVDVTFTPNTGAFMLTQGKTVKTNASGVFSVTLIREAWYFVQADASGLVGKLGKGMLFQVPDVASVNLETLVPAVTVPSSYLVAIPVLSLIDSTSSLTYRADSLRLGSGATVIAPTNGGDTPTLIIRATGDTSGTTNRPELTNAENDIKTIRDIANGKGDGDSLQTAASLAAAAIAKADSGALHAQKFAVLNDQIAGLSDADSVSLQVALIKNIIAALADADSMKLAFDRLGDRENADSTLIKISLSLDSALTLAERALSSTKRIFSAMDSVTLTVAPNETINLANGNSFRLTLTANDTLGFTGGIDGQVIQVVVTNANNFTLAWSGVAWPGGTAPTLTAVQNKRSIFSFIQSGGMIHGVSVLNY